MRSAWSGLLDGLALLGFDLRKAADSVRGAAPYMSDLRALRRQSAESAIPFPIGQLYPCLTDRYAQSGMAKGHYFHQDLLVASRVFLASPKRHIDVGSRVDGFVAHVATFREIEVLDIRPLASSVKNIRFLQCDLMSELPPAFVECCDSLSCLHALEHFGLGRYGDPVRFDGHLVGLRNLARMVKPGGKLYLSVPIGPQRIDFNAHRVFSVRYLLDLVAESFAVDRFSFVDDEGSLHEGVVLAQEPIANSYGCTYGCGILELTRKDRT